jgi:hypothetical protein
MIVKCVALRLNTSRPEADASDYFRNRDFGVVVGREYLVLALTIDFGSAPPGTGTGAWVDVLMEPSIPTIIPVPLFLFEITDPKISCHWEARLSQEGLIRLCPPAFCRDSFLEDVSERVPSAVDEFSRIYNSLAAETGRLEFAQERNF